MSTITGRLAAVPQIPLRLAVAVAFLLVAALIAILVAGSHIPKPAPAFGPASNGGIPYMSHGKLYLGDLESGNSRLLVDSADGLIGASPDGTRVAFIKLENLNGSQTTNIYVVRPDGSRTEKVNMPAPIFDADYVWTGWMPDSRHIAFIHAVNSVNQLDLFDVSGNEPVKRLGAAAGLTELAFRPPDGQEILFRAGSRNSAGVLSFGLYAMDTRGSQVHTLLARPAAVADSLDLTAPTYLLDGSKIFFNSWTDDASGGDPGCCQLYVMNADGSDQHEFIVNPGTAWDGDATVSPDGAMIAFWHNVNSAGDHGIFVIRADGTGPIVETGPPIHGLGLYRWSPDSSRILMYMRDDSNTPAYLLDPRGGPFATTPWSQDNDIDWQRVAPPS